ncbi:efflux RND transporter periplasmic adaptor subunit [Alkaliphilus transvaalensis]|uniref:efflux RND transporter periplasmic adaptor subunit n=1 Tax=Alkaliphilus transvaalensis TaxID=114628 RepID=UPI00047DA2CA|nr:efflux RND transporter periplasmic adaptor subunit [Alkaliphilus transvaalensis]
MGKKTLQKMALILALILVLVVTLNGCRQQARPEVDERTTVEVIAVNRKEIVDVVTLRGQLKPREEVMVIAKTPGLKVTQLAVEIGDEVKVGQFLFELDKTLARKQVEQTKMNYDIARRSYTQQRQLQENNKPQMEDLEDSLSVFQNMTRVPSQYQEMLNHNLEAQMAQQKELEVAQATASAQLEQARMAYVNSLEQLGELEYFAPIAGVVSQLNIEKNHMILNNSPALVISNINELKVTLSVSSTLLNSLERGGRVTVRQGQKEFDGVIKTINPITDLRSNLHTVEIVVDNREGKVTSGEFILVDIEGAKKENAVVVPKAALVTEGKDTFVFIEIDGMAKKRKVELGIDAGSEVEIIGGLQGGEVVIIKGQHFIEDDTPVIVRGKSNEDY